jgi:hypothetical protein
MKNNSKTVDWIKNLTNNEIILVILLFLFNLVLVYPKLMPEFIEINPHDGAKYIESGRMLFIWGTRQLSWGPIVALIYAPIHLFVGQSADWFMIETWAGNFIMFSLIWFSFYYLSRQVRHLVSPYVMIALMIVLSAFFPVLKNPSDAVFLFLTVFALSNLIKYWYSKEINHLWVASIFVGLGVFARVETIILLATLLIFGLVIGRKKTPVYKTLIACMVPTISLLILFITINMIVFGHPNLGIAEKSYDSLQWNQAVLTGGDLTKAYTESDQLFGTKEENQGSVIKAIIKNPGAIIARVWANIKNVPDAYLRIFGRVQGFILLFFCVWGLYELIRKKETLLWILLLAWPLHALIVLIFLSDHLIPQVSYLFYLLAAIGIWSFYDKGTSFIHKAVFLFFSLAVVTICILDNRPKLLMALVLFSLSMIIDLVVGLKALLNGFLRVIPAILLLGIMLAFGEQFGYAPKQIGVSQIELAVKYLSAALPKQSNVLSVLPIPAVAAKMNPYDLQQVNEFENNPQQLMEFINANQIHAIFLDEMYSPKANEVMEDFIDQYPALFSYSYESEDGSIDIYLVNYN